MKAKFNISFQPLTKNSKMLKEVEQIYLQSFPENERVPFNELFLGKFKDCERFAFVIDGEVVGFSIGVIENNIQYLMWLAVKENWRDIGVGSQILKILKKMHPDCSVAIALENPKDKKASNKVQRKLRHKFYKKNKFKTSKLNFECLGEMYVLINLGEVNQQNFINLVKEFFPDSNNFKNSKKLLNNIGGGGITN